MGQICTPDEIRALEEKYSVALPGKYKAFLSAGDALFQEIMVGSDFHPPYLENLNKWAKELLEEDGNPFSLKPGDFVFSMHQGYQFMFFNCTEGSDDPPVYYYLEGAKEVQEVAPSFTSYIATTRTEVEQGVDPNA